MKSSKRLLGFAPFIILVVALAWVGAKDTGRTNVGVDAVKKATRGKRF